MKKKLALLLASVMTLSALTPLSVFAEKGSIVNPASTIPGKTLFVERTSRDASGALRLGDKEKTDDMEFILKGSDLLIPIKNDDSSTTGDSFRINLTNSIWAFAQKDVVTMNEKFIKKFDPKKVGNENLIKNLGDVLVNELFESTLTSRAVSGTDYKWKETAGSTTKLQDELGSNVFGMLTDYATYNTESGIYRESSKSNNYGYYVRYGVDGKEVPYILETNDLNQTSAKVTILDDVDNYKSGNSESDTAYIRIPLVSLTSSGDVRATISDSNISGIDNLTYSYGNATGGSSKTVSSVKTTVDAKFSFPIDQFIIKERLVSSLKKDGKITLTAPYGYYWSDPKDSDDEVILNTVDGLEFQKGSFNSNNVFEATGARVREVINKEYSHGLVYLRTDKNKSDEVTYDYENRELIIDFSKNVQLVPSSNEVGELRIKGLVLHAEDYATYDKDVLVKVSGNGTTEENVKIGTRRDWNIILTAKEPIPTLVNGRYVVTNNDRRTVSEQYHRTADVSFKENTVAAWWSLRQTELTLPEGVKFIKVEIDNEKNLDHKNRSYKLERDDPYLLKGDDNSTSIQSNVRDGYVTLEPNKLIITDLSLKANEKASFDLYSWVSIQSGFEGDVTLTATGSAIPDEIKPVVIAKAVSPITVDTTVTDVKIGYQWQKVADFTITETAAGRLLRGTQVRISIDDNISDTDEIYFAPDTVVEKSGNILFSKPTVNKGEIIFNIERVSSDKAAAIKFSNVYVKIDRTVPESNKRPYKVVVGGTAVAANYHESPGYYSDKFAVKGIGADYLNVVTSANDKDSILSNVVKVTIGSDTVLVGKNDPTEVKMDTAAYISADSNSTMVPVRFVSIALGIPENQVQWDEENRTVTILNGSRIIQFKIGSTEIVINGVSTTMYSPDVPPKKVAAEIKDNRSFLPFRALGNALGVDVDWDADTNTAIYNAKLLEENTTSSDTTVAE